MKPYHDIDNRAYTSKGEQHLTFTMCVYCDCFVLSLKREKYLLTFSYRTRRTLDLFYRIIFALLFHDFKKNSYSFTDRKDLFLLLNRSHMYVLSSHGGKVHLLSYASSNESMRVAKYDQFRKIYHHATKDVAPPFSC